VIFFYVISSIMKVCFLTFTLSKRKKHFLSYIELFGAIQPDVGSSGTAQMPQIHDLGPHIPARLFSSPTSTPLDGSHDTHPQAATQPGSGGGDRDELMMWIIRLHFLE
jgi:hypothetical protein